MTTHYRADNGIDAGVQNQGDKDRPGGYPGLDSNGKVNKSVIPPAAAQADSVASTVGGVVTDFNALLAKLRAAGLLAP